MSGWWRSQQHHTRHTRYISGMMKLHDYYQDTKIVFDSTQPMSLCNSCSLFHSPMQSYSVHWKQISRVSTNYGLCFGCRPKNAEPTSKEENWCFIAYRSIYEHGLPWKHELVKRNKIVNKMNSQELRKALVRKNATFDIRIVLQLMNFLMIKINTNISKIRVWPCIWGV